MLKIALPTFKNDENHTQNSKIHTQNSVCEVRCGKILCGNGKMYAVFGGFMIDFGMFCRACGGFHVFFRRLQGLFAAKMRCENGKSIVRKWWLGFVISVEIHCVAAVAWCNAAVDTLKSAKSCAVAANAVSVFCILVANAAVGGAEMVIWIVDFGGWWCGCGVFVFGFFMI